MHVRNNDMSVYCQLGLVWNVRYCQTVQSEPTLKISRMILRFDLHVATISLSFLAWRTCMIAFRLLGFPVFDLISDLISSTVLESRAHSTNYARH